MNLEIRHLKLVEAVAETGSVTRAGHRLHLTQSALSHQLRDAEEQLGVALFERKNGRMSLTSAGDRLLETARTVLTELAESEIQGSSGPARGLLRISTQCHTVYHWFPPRLLIFQKKFPNVEVQLVLEASSDPFEALLEGKLDLAIICDPIRNRKIRYTPLFEDDVLIVVPPGHGRFCSGNYPRLSPQIRKHAVDQNPRTSTDPAAKDSGSATDRSDLRDDHRRAGDCCSSTLGGRAACCFRRGDGRAARAARLSLAVVGGSVARRSCTGLRARVRPDHRRAPHACRFLSPGKLFSKPGRAGWTPRSCRSDGLRACGAFFPQASIKRGRADPPDARSSEQDGLQLLRAW
jgi:DNA-binding transcriptional LysR family regulator